MLENYWSAVGNRTSALGPSGSSFGPSGLTPVGIHHLLMGNLTTGCAPETIRARIPIRRGTFVGHFGHARWLAVGILNILNFI